QQTAEILQRMLAKDPADRFPSCHELVAALEAHPLVARGGTIKLAVAKPVTATDATVVGAPTPASQPQRVPTPPPRVSTPAPQGAAAASVPAAAVASDAATRGGAPARPSVLERSQRSSSPMLPLAIVAVLVLALAGGAFAFRGPLMDFAGGFV